MATHASSIFIMDGDNYLSCLSNSMTARMSQDVADSTTFCSGGVKERIPTLAGMGVQVSTFIDEVAAHSTYNSGLQPTDRWMLLNYRAPQSGDTFHAMESLCEGGAAIGGDVSGLVQADLSFLNETKYIIHGQGASSGGVLEWTTQTATGDGTGLNFGALGANDTLYAWLAVDRATVSGTLPTLDVVIERDAADTWGGAETTVYTFSQATASANTFQVKNSVSGTQAETWYRATWTIGGTATPTFRFFVGLGVTTLT
jgi:hypothetical protein